MLVTHQLQFLKSADRILCLKEVCRNFFWPVGVRGRKVKSKWGGVRKGEGEEELEGVRVER